MASREIDVKNKISALAAKLYPELVQIRRHLHSHPELSREEAETAEFICSMLEKYGIPFTRGIAGTGVVALVAGKNPGKRCMALRADMDALAIHEENKTGYKSVNEGKMHACGHDVHMACLLGAGNILNHIKDNLEGTVKLIFQPSEEIYPGGAIGMIRAGVLKDPDTFSVIGQHVINTVDVGKVGMKAGPYMASTDEVFLKVKGKGGHAATPDQVVDPILIASYIIVALQQIVSRNANPLIPTVLSFGRITGDGRTNIIPGEVTVEGTVRTYDEAWRKTVHKKIGTMAKGIAKSMGGDCKVTISYGYPVLNNDEKVTTKVRQWSAEYLGEKNVMDLEARMTAEDFSYYALEVPSCFYRLGIRNEAKGIRSNLHTSTFDVDESCLETGAGLMAYIAQKMLSE